MGHDYYQLNDEAKNRCCAFVDTIDIENPKYFQGTIPLLPLGYSVFRQEWNGVFFQDQMVLWGKLHILGGGRYDWASYGTSFSSLSFSDSENILKQNTLQSEKFSPRVGLLYQPVSWLSLYANFTEGLGGNNSFRSRDGKPLAPKESRQYEAGIKTEFFDGKLTSSLAFFDIRKTNVAIGDPDPTLALRGIGRALGEARSTGIEFDIAGQVDENWSIIGNYAFTDTEITKDNSTTNPGLFGGGSFLGNRLPNAPKHSANIWAKYSFTEPLLKGLDISSGIHVVSQRQGDPANDFQLPGYVTWDAAAAYSFKLGDTKLTAQFNAYNLLDKHYFASTDTLDQSFRFYGSIPAAPRTFMGSVRVEY